MGNDRICNVAGASCERSSEEQRWRSIHRKNFRPNITGIRLSVDYCARLYCSSAHPADEPERSAVSYCSMELVLLLSLARTCSFSQNTVEMEMGGGLNLPGLMCAFTRGRGTTIMWIPKHTVFTDCSDSPYESLSVCYFFCLHKYPEAKRFPCHLPNVKRHSST